MNTPERTLYKSFKSAFTGLAIAFKSERNFRIHSLAAGIVAITLILLPFERWEQLTLVLVTVLVLVLELANSSLERLVDLAKPRVHEYAAEAKELMAGAVFLAASAALIIGILLIGPHLFALFHV